MHFIEGKYATLGIAVINRDGSGLDWLYRNADPLHFIVNLPKHNNGGGLSWSPDGDYIAFVQEIGMGPTYIYQLDIETKEISCLSCALEGDFKNAKNRNRHGSLSKKIIVLQMGTHYFGSRENNSTGRNRPSPIWGRSTPLAWMAPAALHPVVEETSTPTEAARSEPQLKSQRKPRLPQTRLCLNPVAKPRTPLETPGSGRT